MIEMYELIDTYHENDLIFLKKRKNSYKLFIFYNCFDFLF